MRPRDEKPSNRGPSGLRLPWEPFRDRVRAYYSVLNVDPDWRETDERPRFSEGLAELFRVFQPLWQEAQACATPVGAWLDEIGPWLANEAALDEALAFAQDEGYDWASGDCGCVAIGRQVRQLLDPFIARWRLPPASTEDLWLSFETWLDDSSAMLNADWGPSGYLSFLPRRVSPDAVQAAGATPSGIWAERGLIVPPSPLPFTYNPASTSRGELKGIVDELLTQIRESIFEQADEFEKLFQAKGWTKTPPRHVGEAGQRELEKGARRLYRYAICGWSYADIAEREWREGNRDGDDRYLDASAIGKMVRDWAERLRISLPR